MNFIRNGRYIINFMLSLINIRGSYCKIYITIPTYNLNILGYHSLETKFHGCVERIKHVLRFESSNCKRSRKYGNINHYFIQ